MLELGRGSNGKARKLASQGGLVGAQALYGRAGVGTRIGLRGQRLQLGERAGQLGLQNGARIAVAGTLGGDVVPERRGGRSAARLRHRKSNR